VTVEAVAIAILAALLIAQQYLFVVERAKWATERKELINRAIARHAGEIVALDREGKPKPERDDKPPVYVEGLS
jgi:hypothetical protein